MGIAGVLSTLGYAAGPVITGWIHDRTGSYVPALWLSSECRSYASSRASRAGRCQSVLDERTRAKPPEGGRRVHHRGTETQA